MRALRQATNKPLCMVPRSDAHDVDVAVRAASEAGVGWARTPVAKRAELLNAVADGIEAEHGARNRDRGPAPLGPPALRWARVSPRQFESALLLLRLRGPAIGLTAPCGS